MSAAAPSAESPRLTWPVRFCVALVKAYQGAASGRVSPCRFYPSCSNYAAEAFAVHGFWRGLRLTGGRLVRCRPFGPHGVDLVPLPVHTHRHSYPTSRLRLPEGGRP